MINKEQRSQASKDEKIETECSIFLKEARSQVLLEHLQKTLYILPKC